MMVDFSCMRGDSNIFLSIINDLIKLLMRVQIIYTGIRRTPTTGWKCRTPVEALESSIIALQKSQVATDVCSTKLLILEN